MAARETFTATAEEARTLLARVIAHLKENQNGDSACCKTLEEAGALLGETKKAPQAKKIKELLLRAHEELAGLIKYTSPAPWNKAVELNAAALPGPGKNPKKAGRKLASSSPPGWYVLAELQEDVSAHIRAVLLYIEPLERLHSDIDKDVKAAKENGNTFKRVDAQLHLMRACLERK